MSSGQVVKSIYRPLLFFLKPWLVCRTWKDALRENTQLEHPPQATCEPLALTKSLQTPHVTIPYMSGSPMQLQ